ncbi:hypothetical protein FA13DRAFT_1788778 [Coprinellus micaceus]|uniref:BRCT domain-containing protein n=1 Tax=Coprinellus micaceus TaxID=71717 RepID=A0A4Y7TMQ5_COPMI|nr:hypothetical protein FA13DRAFT_1788778 [Coprinellus micaceus]
MSISSTPAASSIADLFVTPDGATLVIFFQAHNVGPRRAPLAKILQKGGAYLCTDPKDADILLVDPESVDGKQHIRTWVAGGDKLGLHYRWIDACVKAGRMLADGDGWGGFIAVDDGAPLGDDEDDELGESAQKSACTFVTL